LGFKGLIHSTSNERFAVTIALPSIHMIQQRTQGSHASWKVQEFFCKISRNWKVLENGFGLGKSWKFKLKVLEFAGTQTQ